MSATPHSPTSQGVRPILEVQDLRVRFSLPEGPSDVIDGVSFSVMPGEILSVVGESGSGKTVLMHSLLGLSSVLPGVIGGRFTVRFGGKEQDLLEGLPAFLMQEPGQAAGLVRKKPGWTRLYRKRTRNLLGRHLGLIFQNPRNALDPLMSVGDQICESIASAEPGIAPQDRRRHALEWLERVRIDRPAEVYDLYPHQLSGGMCQRVAIAQILALKPDVLIADEPTTGLDATIQVGILELIREVQRAMGLAVVLITHDFAVVERLADRILVLYKGRLLEIGAASEILGSQTGLHPYTAELLRNVRVLEKVGGIAALRSLAAPVMPPGTQHLSASGCNFIRRCRVSASGSEDLQKRCRGQLPDLHTLSPTHCVRCHVADQLRAEPS